MLLGIIGVFVLFFSFTFSFFLVRTIEKTVNKDDTSSRDRILTVFSFCLLAFSALYFLIVLID